MPDLFDRDVERRLRILEASTGRVPVLTADPASPPSGGIWILSGTGELRYKPNGVTVALDSRYVSVPTAWTAVLGGVGFTNSWVNFGGGEQVARYRKIGDAVFVEGLIKSGTLAAAFTLPAGFRPPLNVYFASTANDLFGSFYVTSAGAVTIRAGSNVFFSVNCSFSTV